MNIPDKISSFFSLIKNHPWKTIAVVGIVWLLFFDRDSVFYQFKINKEIRELEKQNDLLKKKIDSTQKVLEHMNERKYLERYAREVLLIKKADEDIFLIDTTRYER